MDRIWKHFVYLAQHLPEAIDAVAVVLEPHLVQVNDVGAHAVMTEQERG